MIKGAKRKKPAFNRQGWDRYLRLGKTVKKRRHWRRVVGGDSKIRLRERGRAARPTIGWGSEKEIRGKVNGMNVVRVENMTQLNEIKKGNAIVIGSIGKKKRMQLIEEANKKGLKIINKYRKKKDAIKE